MISYSSRSMLAAAIVAVFTGCAEAPKDPVGPPNELGFDAVPPFPLAAVRGERHFREMNRRFPQFAGYYFDEAGNLIVHVSGTGHDESLREAVLPVLRKRQTMASWASRSSGRVMVKTVKHSFADLDRWRGILREDILTQDGFVFLDLDEVANRLVVGVLPSKVAAVRARLSSIYG